MRHFGQDAKKVNIGLPGFLSGLLKKPLAGLLIGVSVLAAATAGTFAWVSFGRRASGTDRVTSDDYLLFELGAVKNAAGTARKISVDSIVLDTLSSHPGRDYGRDVLDTSESCTGVICGLETDDGNPLRPGSTGKLQFRITPKKSGLTLYGTLLLMGIKKTVDDVNETVTYDFMDEADAGDVKALGYLGTHILFFADNAKTTRIDLEDMIYIDDAATANASYVATIYWEWPRTYSDHDAYVDAAWLGSHVYLEEEEGDAGYNNADQVIGERVSHVIVEVNMTGTHVPNGAELHEVAAAPLS